MQVLERTRELHPDTEVIMITGYATVTSAVEAMQRGAYHYLAKPYKIEEVRILVRQALERRWLKREVSELRQQIQSQKGMPLLIGKTPKMEALKAIIRQIAPTDCTVLILGETGTGKELVAKTIHHLSPRSEQRFLAINCGSFTEELLAHELFGHEKEAFTGARGVKKGLLEVATGGTVFLDEIAEMSLSMQVKLLRVLQDKTFFRIGGTTEVPVDIRILAATNKDLKKEVDEAPFARTCITALTSLPWRCPPWRSGRMISPFSASTFWKNSPGPRGNRWKDQPGGDGYPDQIRFSGERAGIGEHYRAGGHPGLGLHGGGLAPAGGPAGTAL
jgi:DNA-binding NtrC family response regulator